VSVITKASSMVKHEVFMTGNKVGWCHREHDRYVLIGHKPTGEKFRLEYTDFSIADRINMWSGRMYLKRDGHLILVKSVHN
jgi:hypothetical protein